MTIHGDGYCCYFQVKNTLDFISKYRCLNRALKDDIEPLKKRMKEMDKVEGKFMFPEFFFTESLKVWWPDQLIIRNDTLYRLLDYKDV